MRRLIPTLPVHLWRCTLLAIGLACVATARWAAAADIAAQFGTGPLGGPVAGGEAAIPVHIEARVEPATAEAAATLAITARLDEGWHLYSVDQKPGGPKATKIQVSADSPQVPAGPFRPSVPPHARTVNDVPAWKGLVVEEHSGTVIWKAPLKPNPEGKSGKIKGTVSLQLCRDNACTPPETIPFTAVSGGSGDSGKGAAIDTLSPKAVGFDADSSRTGPLEAGSSAAGSTQPGSSGLAPLPPASQASASGHLKIEASFGPSRPSSAGRVWPLLLRIRPEPDWHVYAPGSTPESGVGQGKPTIVSLPESDTVRATRLTTLEATASTTGELAASAAVDGPVAVEVLLEPRAEESADRSIDLIVGYQTCSDSTCDPPGATRLTVKLPTDDDPASGRISFAAARYAEAAKAPAAIDPPAGAAGLVPTRSASISQMPPEAVAAMAPATQPSSISLPMALLMGLAGGLILNLMPCVLPVLGLKLMSFAQQSGRARQEVFETNLWYCAGLFAVFFVLATASVAANIGLGSENLAWGEQFTSTRFNVTMAAVVFAFALSFLGVWELPIPGFIGERAGHVQSKEGPMGAFLKGVLSTVLATPCSGPFLGPVFGFTLSQPTLVTYAVFGAIATGMSLPYLLVGMFPGLVKFLPKPGAWMETLKEVLGFVMLGTVVFLFTFLDHDYFVPTFALLIGIWAACWWVGRAQEASAGSAGFGRWVQAASIAAVVGSLAFAFLGPVPSILPWEPFSRARLAELRSRGATVLVDFSADWCMTCKLNLATAIETSRVKAAIESNRIVPLLADWTEESPEIKSMLETLQSRSIPVLAVFPAGPPNQPPREPIVLRDLITESQVLEAIRTAGPSRPTITDLRAAALP